MIRMLHCNVLLVAKSSWGSLFNLIFGLHFGLESARSTQRCFVFGGAVANIFINYWE